MLRSDRKKIAGVAMYIKQNIKAKVSAKSFDDDCKVENAEFIFVECSLNGGLFAIAAVYRTSSCNILHTTNLCKMHIELSSKYRDVIIVGDFNINILDTISSIKFMTDHFEIINQFCPTHRWPNAPPSLIDIAFTKSRSRVDFYGHYNLIPATHHDLIVISYRIHNLNISHGCNFSYRD